MAFLACASVIGALIAVGFLGFGLGFGLFAAFFFVDCFLYTKVGVCCNFKIFLFIFFGLQFFTYRPPNLRGAI